MPEVQTLGERMASLSAQFTAQDEFICKTLERIEKKLDDHIAGSRADKDSHNRDHQEINDRMTTAEGQISTGKRILGATSTIAVSALTAALKTMLHI